jgi:hypothetical protein
MSEFFTQATNLLAQQLATIKGEEIYTKTACMDPEYRQAIALLQGLKDLAPNAQKQISKIMPLMELLGKASWNRSELTDLGLRVGQRNVQEINDDERIEDKAEP